jgi:hypothetical protein
MVPPERISTAGRKFARKIPRRRGCRARPATVLPQRAGRSLVETLEKAIEVTDLGGARPMIAGDLVQEDVQENREAR